MRKCHFAYIWQIVGGVIPSNCGICTPEVAFSCYDLPHISEMEVFISCNLPHISEMKCVSLLGCSGHGLFGPQLLDTYMPDGSRWPSMLGEVI